MTSTPITRPFAVVLNPNAGSGLALRQWPTLKAELERRGVNYTLIQEADGASALARIQSLPADVAVLAVGGDGTVGALLPAVVGTGRPLAVMPLGTGNDFAGMLKLGSSQFAEALDRLSHQPRQLDALEVQIVQGDELGAKYVLLNGLGMGFDSQVTANMARAPERFQGFSRYAWAALSTIRELTLSRVKVSVDGQELYAGPSALVAVMNGTRYGGGFQISPSSDARDGLLNVLASGPVNRLQLLLLMIKVLRGAHLGSPHVYHATGREVEIRWEQPTYLHLDGDLHGQITHIKVRVLPQSVELLNG